MGHKNQFPFTFGWQSTNPQIGFLPLNNNTQGQGSNSSGVINGVMTSTNTIYTNILDISRMDNTGLEIAWTGTPTGVISYWGSNSGINFFQVSLTTSQPAGSASCFGVNLNQWSYKYIQIQYVNTSGSGVISIYGQAKDLN